MGKGYINDKKENDIEFSADIVDEYDEVSGENQSKYSPEELVDINIEVIKAIKQGVIPANIGAALNPVPLKIRKSEEHSVDRYKDRDVTDEEAQEYIDYAVIMFGQSGGRNLYISKDGSSVIVNYTGVLVTVIPARKFKPHIKYILGGILNLEEFK